jgi:hypothetical protein
VSSTASTAKLGEASTRTEPEFFNQPSCPFYQYAVGRQSPYGDEAHVFLRMISTQGFFEAGDCCEEAFRFLRAYMDKGGGRTNGVLRTFVERRTSGMEWPQCASQHDVQFFAVTKVPILVARYAGSPQLLDRVEDAVRMFQTSETALAACRLAARLLERVVLGDSVVNTLRWALADGELPPAERAFLCVLEGIDGFGGLRVVSDGEGGEEGVCPPVDRTDLDDDAAEEYVDTGDDDDDGDSDQPVHAIVTNGDCDLIFATNAHTADAAETTAAYFGGSSLSAVLASVRVMEGQGDGLYDSTDNEQKLSPTAAITSPNTSVDSGPASSSASSPSSAGQQPNVTATTTITPRQSASASASTSTRSVGIGIPVVAVEGTVGSSSNNNSSSSKNSTGSSGNCVSRAPMLPFSVACEELGLSSQLPGCMQAALYALACFPSYTTAVRANIVAGGDNALRAWFVASLLAAEQGKQACAKTYYTVSLLWQ